MEMVCLEPRTLSIQNSTITSWLLLCLPQLVHYCHFSINEQKWVPSCLKAHAYLQQNVDLNMGIIKSNRSLPSPRCMTKQVSNWPCDSLPKKSRAEAYFVGLLIGGYRSCIFSECTQLIWLHCIWYFIWVATFYEFVSLTWHNPTCPLMNVRGSFST